MGLNRVESEIDHRQDLRRAKMGIHWTRKETFEKRDLKRQTRKERFEKGHSENVTY